MTVAGWANRRSGPALSRTYLARKASRLAFFVLCGLVFVPVSSLGQTSAETSRPNVLQEISDAVARIAEQTTPAVVGIWVDIKSAPTQTSSKGAPREPGSQEEGQSTEASEQILHKYIMPYRSRNLGTAFKGQAPHLRPQVTARDQKQPPCKEAPSDQFPQMQPHKLALGTALQDLTAEMAQRLNYQGQTGVVVVAVADDSPADGADITAGMLIQEVNRRSIANLSELKTALERAAEKPPLLLLVNNQGAYSFVVIAPPEKGQ